MSDRRFEYFFSDRCPTCGHDPADSADPAAPAAEPNLVDQAVAILKKRERDKLQEVLAPFLAAPSQPAEQAAADPIREAIGCFEAAEVEGLSIALAETKDERLKDLVERRLMHALPALQAARRPVRELTAAETNHLWQTIYDHGNGKYKGLASQAQREKAFSILAKVKE